MSMISNIFLVFEMVGKQMKIIGFLTIDFIIPFF